jgi:hypothetical protein
LTFPATNSSTMRKMKPVKTPIPTHASMILGPSTAGLGISSITKSFSAFGPSISEKELTVSHGIEPGQTETSLEQPQ